ncbi:hypothetical protein [Methylobacterium tardum]|uniref:hypothetical protein n=1 Tax=Methylobacterium tardum TaxID=374432 RepID=UPI0036181599
MPSRTTLRFTLTALIGLAAGPALAQSTGYVTGFPGKDPAGDEEIGWGPAYRPETSFSQPGTPPTPGRSPAAPTGRAPGTASTTGSRATVRTGAAEAGS